MRRSLTIVNSHGEGAHFWEEESHTMNTKLAAFFLSAALLGSASQASAATLVFDMVAEPGPGNPLSVTGSDSNVFTFSAGASSGFEAIQSGGIGSFPSGTYFLNPGLGLADAPTTVSFASPISSISLLVSSDRVGDSPFSTTVNFFDGGSLVDSITKAGNTLNPPATFSFNGALTSVVISTTVDSAYATFGYTQNIGEITYVSSVPLPASAPMFGAALLALGAVGYGMKRKAA